MAVFVYARILLAEVLVLILYYLKQSHVLVYSFVIICVHIFC